MLQLVDLVHQAAQRHRRIAPPKRARCARQVGKNLKLLVQHLQRRKRVWAVVEWKHTGAPGNNCVQPASQQLAHVRQHYTMTCNLAPPPPTLTCIPPQPIPTWKFLSDQPGRKATHCTSS